jgi:hypothetical protein
MSPHADCRSRKVRASPSLSSHRIRSAQRRPSRSSSAIWGRPVRDPRTARPGSGVAPEAAGAGDDPAWSDRDGHLVRLVDELHDTCTVTDELWAALAAEFAPDQLLELLITAGWYRLLSYVINGAQVPLEPWALRFPAGPSR